MIAQDFFGPRLRRRARQSDESFRTRIKLELLRERSTKQALICAVADLTGRSPTVFEPGHCGDTGAYGFPLSSVNNPVLGFAYGLAGGWGNRDLPFQVFITAFRPAREAGTNGLG